MTTGPHQGLFARNHHPTRRVPIIEFLRILTTNWISKSTVEERIHQLQAKKSQLADSLLSDAARAAAQDESTLSALLAPLG